MGSKCWQLRTPFSPCHSLKTPRAVLSSPLRNVTDRNSAMPCRLVYASAFSGFRNLRVQRVKRACSAQFDDFHQEEMMNLIHVDDENNKEIAYTVSENNQNTELKNGSSEQFRTMKPDLLEPSLLGIEPEPPSWPERDEILRLSFERKVNGVEIPLSIRMIKKKLQLQKGLQEASDLTYCSVKRAFSSMLFIIQGLQNHDLQIKESLCCGDLQGVMAKLRREMDASFVWLFQKVFWKTPTLMVHLMVLLANFSVFSMSNNTAMAATPNSSMVNKVLQFGAEVEDIKEELTEEEEVLWNSLVEEASMLQKQLGSEILEHETMRGFVAPMSVELEGDLYEEYVQTELYYKKHLRLWPNNSLLLSNYAQFLYLVLHDLAGAEEYYRRSVLVESPEAEAFCRYADFLWLVRKDIWAAELRYLQGLEAEPGNTYCSSRYASFLWGTGGQDPSSFPIEEFDNLQI